jgi:hypothetical protein
MRVGRIIGVTIRFVRALAPWILRLMWQAFILVLATILALFRGVIPQSRQLATFWTNEVLRKGDLPNIWAKYIYPVMFAFALLTMAVGWVITAHLTVWLLHMIF